jgi:hypothetical protein
MNFPQVNRVGNVALCFALRGGYFGPLSAFLRDMRDTQKQLVFLDSVANHDDLLPDEILEKASDWRLDHIKGALHLAANDLRDSLTKLEAAHDRIAGLFKGQMRDETEEALARALNGARQRFAKMDELASNYELPKRPHEIRRNSLSYLIQQSIEVHKGFLYMMEHQLDDKVDADLLAEMHACGAELTKVRTQLETLRERCSQKMSGNMQAVVTFLEGVYDRMSEVELQAGLRARLPFADYHRRTPKVPVRVSSAK